VDADQVAGDQRLPGDLADGGERLARPDLVDRGRGGSGWNEQRGGERGGGEAAHA